MRLSWDGDQAGDSSLCLAFPPSFPVSHGCFLLKQNIINNSRLFLNLTLERVVGLRGTGSGGCATGWGAAQPLPPVLWLLVAAKPSAAVVRSLGGAGVGEPRAVGLHGTARGRGCFPGRGLDTF